MKRILTILFLSIIFICEYHPQSYKFAVFNNLNIDKDSSANVLSEKINLINKNPEIKFLIILSNITSHGYADEFELVSSILDSCNIPYYLLPGTNDIELSQTLGADYKLSFEKKSFAFENENISHIGIKGIKYELGEKFHFTPEEINSLKKYVNNIPSNHPILLYINKSLENFDNKLQIQNILSNRNLFIVRPGKKTNYNIFSVADDTVKTDFDYFDSLSTKIEFEKNYFTLKDTAQFVDYSNLKGNKLPKIKAKLIWQRNLSTETPNNILVSNDKLFVINKEGIIYCLDFEGKILWTYNIGEITISKPAVIKNLLITATTEGDLLTIDTKNGNIVQSIGIDDALITSVLKTKINYYGEETDAVIVGGSSGTFYCYTLKKLELVWNNVFSNSDIITEPITVNHRIIFGSKDGYLYSIDDRTGVLYWKWKPKRVKKQIVDFSNPICDGKNIFISTSNGIIYKIDLLLGTTVWKISKQKSNLSLGLSSTGRTIISRTTKGKVKLFYSKTGQKYGNIRLNFGEEVIKHEPTEWKRNFIISSDEGTVYIIDKRYKHKPLFFLGNSALHSIQKIDNNKFITSNVDGKIIYFSLQ